MRFFAEEFGADYSIQPTFGEYALMMTNPDTEMSKEMAGKKKDLPFGITFGDPPPPPQERRNDVFWTTVADTLRENPNKWARVKVYESKGGATGRANQINSGKSPFFPKPEFSARYVQTSDGQFSELWVCYTPAGSE